MNAENSLYVLKLLLTCLAAIVTFTCGIAFILAIIDRVFHENSNPLLITAKKNCFSILMFLIIILFPLNIIMGIIQGLVWSPSMSGYYLSYLLISIKLLALYYILNGWIKPKSKVKNILLSVTDKTFIRKKTFGLIVTILVTSIVMALLNYFPSMKTHEFLQQNISSGFFLSLISDYRNPLWFEVLSLFFTALIHSFLIVYTAILYPKQKIPGLPK
jgi:hypothetical protein